MLAVFSGLSLNLILQFGLGLKEVTLTRNTGLSEYSGLNAQINIKGLLVGSGMQFITVMILWLSFSFLRSVVFLGLVEYVLLFPVSFLFFSFFEYLIRDFIFKQRINLDALAAGAPVCGASVGTALFITLNIAGSVSEAAVLSLGFSCGILLAVIVAGEIRRRSQMERVPHWLRGAPLMVIALGLLSLVFSSGALMLFQVLGT
jgi:electron transport complex protein RnfA